MYKIQDWLNLKYDYSTEITICYIHALCQLISIFQVQLFHIYGAYKGYMGVTYMSIVSPIYVPWKSNISGL